MKIRFQEKAEPILEMVQRSKVRQGAKSKQQHSSKKLAVMDTEGRNGSFISLIESLVFFLPSVPCSAPSFMFAFSDAHLHVTSENTFLKCAQGFAVKLLQRH